MLETNGPAQQWVQKEGKLLNMIIYLGNVPKRFGQYELRRLIERLLIPEGFGQTARQFFSRSGRLKKAEYLVITERKSLGEVRYGKVTIEPRKVGLRLIPQLNKMQYKGHTLRAREFVIRAYINDARSLGWRGKKWVGQERRDADRREPDRTQLEDEFR